MVVLDRLKSSKLDPFLAGNDLRNTAVDGAAIIPTLEDQFAKFAGNGKVEKFIEKSTKNLFPNAKIERVNGELKILDAGDSPNFNQAWNARKGLDDLLYDKKISLNSSAETKGAANVAGGAIRTSINDALKQANPDFENVLGTLAKANKMQTALQTGRGLQDKMKNSATTAVQNEYDMAGVNKYSPFQGSKIGKDLVNSRGQPSDLAQKMTKSQREAFANVAKELERSKALESLGASVGSPTASYIGRGGLLKDDILDSILGARKQGDKAGLLRMAGQGLGNTLDKIGITAPLEESVMQSIKSGLINPDEALTLLEMGRKTQRGLLDVGGGIKKSTQAGLLGGLLAR
jgi:phage gpG-like protein